MPCKNLQRKRQGHDHLRRSLAAAVSLTHSINFKALFSVLLVNVVLLQGWEAGGGQEAAALGLGHGLGPRSFFPSFTSLGLFLHRPSRQQRRRQGRRRVLGRRLGLGSAWRRPADLQADVATTRGRPRLQPRPRPALLNDNFVGNLRDPAVRARKKCNLRMLCSQPPPLALLLPSFRPRCPAPPYLYPALTASLQLFSKAKATKRLLCSALTYLGPLSCT